jgi:hypothetical protein
MCQYARILIGVMLLSAVSQQRGLGSLLWRLLAFAFALALYPFAMLVVFAVALSPLAFALSAWLLWCRHHDGQFPGWVSSSARRARRFAVAHLAHSRAAKFVRRVTQQRLWRACPRQSAAPSMRPAAAPGPSTQTARLASHGDTRKRQSMLR